MMMDPRLSESYNFDEEISTQHYMANVLDYFNIQLPKSPFSVGASLYQKARAHFVEQHSLKCQLQEAAYQAFLQALDGLDFNLMADELFDNCEGAVVIEIRYNEKGEGMISYLINDNLFDHSKLNLPKYSALCSYQVTQLVEELQNTLQTQFAGNALEIYTELNLHLDDDFPHFFLCAHLKLEYFERIQRYLTQNSA
ncbi:hypothetical protein MIR68_007814 [Amoeboaphelidium protococcarum]|nr:hypothetical protein MIR68_007814 [Amoeboaphelidium protococcarum]